MNQVIRNQRLLIYFFPWLLLFNPMCLSGQENDVKDYIISYAGDTTFGTILAGNEFKNQRKITFTDTFGVRAVYKSDRIAGYGFGGSHYASVPTPYYFSGIFSDSTIFLIRRIHGPASLFRFYKRRSFLTLQKGPSFIELIQKPDGKLFEVSFSFKWRRVASAFSDYEQLAREIENGLYTPQEMDKILQNYNQWYLKKQAYQFE